MYKILNIDIYRIKKSILFIFLFSLIITTFSWSKPVEKHDYDKYFNKALSLQKSGKYKEADMVFSEGISKNRNAIKLYYYRAKLRQHNMGDCSRAIQDYTAVIKMNPRYNPKAFWRRGLCFYESELYTSAIRDYSSCLQLIPNYGRVYFLRAQAYAKIGMFINARQDLTAAVKSDQKYKPAAERLYKKMIQGSKDF
jgi:tetratricopeptide (TPR) repeat protein